jgi:phage terminase Nu1 subunit (DNA packaging protein)
VLTSWKEIAEYMRRGVRTVQRWEQDAGLPVRRARSSGKSAVLARPGDLDLWLALHNQRHPEEEDGQVPPGLVELRSRLAKGVEASRVLRENARVLRGEFRSSLVTLSERLEVMSRRVA